MMGCERPKIWVVLLSIVTTSGKDRVSASKIVKLGEGSVTCNNFKASGLAPEPDSVA